MTMMKMIIIMMIFTKHYKDEFYDNIHISFLILYAISFTTHTLHHQYIFFITSSQSILEYHLRDLNNYYTGD